MNANANAENESENGNVKNVRFVRTLLLPPLLLPVFIEDQKVIQFFMRISLLWMRRDSEMTSQCFTHVKESHQQGEGTGRGRT